MWNSVYYLNMIKRNKKSSHSQVPLTAILQMKCRSVYSIWLVTHRKKRSKESTKKRPTAGLKKHDEKKDTRLFLGLPWIVHVDGMPFQIEVEWWKRRCDWGTYHFQAMGKEVPTYTVHIACLEGLHGWRIISWPNSSRLPNWAQIGLKDSQVIQRT